MRVVKDIQVRRVRPEEAERFQELMQPHHYLGALAKIGETLWYVATWCQEWVALLSFSAAALKIAARDRWIGWSYRQQYARLHLLANNTRYCVLPVWHGPNVASRILALCERRLSADWLEAFGHPILLLETFVYPRRHRGTLYRAANWIEVGSTRGYRRRQGGYSATADSPKTVLLRPLSQQARAVLSAADLPAPYAPGVPKLTLTAEQMGSLPEFFRPIPDPRRGQGRRHPLHVVLAIAVAATLCGARGYKHIAEWAEQLSHSARARFLCRRVGGQYLVPSFGVIRDVLMRVDPQHLERALHNWSAQFAPQDRTLALDGKTMRNAIDDSGAHTHLMSVIGHETGACYAKKNGSSPISGERSPDFEEEVLVITEAVGHPLDDFDLVVDALEHAGVQRITAVRQEPRQVAA